MNLGFVILYAHDMEKARTFYTELLGMPIVNEISGPSFVALRPAGGPLIALQAKSASVLPPAREEHPGGVELSFEVDDVDGTWKRWKEQGVTLVTDPTDMPFGRYFMAQDSEGYYLSVYRLAKQPTNPSDSARQGS